MEPKFVIVQWAKKTFFDEREEPIERRPSKRRRLLENDDECTEASDYHTINVTGDEWEEAIDSVVASNDISFVTANNHGTREVQEDIFNMDQGNPTRASVAEIEGILDPSILDHALSESLANSNISMCAGSTVILLNGDNLFIEQPKSLATHAENPRGVTKEMLSKVWRIPEDEARLTIKVKPSSVDRLPIHLSLETWAPMINFWSTHGSIQCSTWKHSM